MIFFLRKNWLLALILVLAFILRFYKLGSLPALNADEAAIGYNAYSLIQTGKDEHGNPWPIHFQSFNDYKPGLYFYLTLPFVKVLVLNEWSVRIPGATLGVLTVLIVYLLVKELKLSEKSEIKHLKLEIVASFFLAISPWHIHFSRGGWEVNAATFFIASGMLLFLKSLKNSEFLIFSILSFIFSLYTYHAARIVTPILGLGLLVFYTPDLKKISRKFLFGTTILGIILFIPFLLSLTTDGFFSRASGVSFIGDKGLISKVNEERGEHDNSRSILVRAIHNKLTIYSSEFFKNWSKHFSADFLFISGDEIQRNKVPETGTMYLHDMILLAAGLYFICKNLKKWRIIIFWLLISPFAAALTFQTPHALRAHNMVIPLVIISAYGFVSILDWVSNWSPTRKRYAQALAGGLGILIAWNFARYQHMYWFHMTKEYPFSSQYGLKELVSYIGKEGDKYKQIVVTDRYDQPYVLFLFYLKYPPQKFQKSHVLTPKDKFGFSTVREFDKFKFISLSEWEKVRDEYPGALIAGTDEEIPDGSNVIERINFPSGKIAFELVKN